MPLQALWRQPPPFQALVTRASPFWVAARFPVPKAPPLSIRPGDNHSRHRTASKLPNSGSRPDNPRNRRVPTKEYYSSNNSPMRRREVRIQHNSPMPSQCPMKTARRSPPHPTIGKAPHKGASPGISRAARKKRIGGETPILFGLVKGDGQPLRPNWAMGTLLCIPLHGLRRTARAVRPYRAARPPCPGPAACTGPWDA